MLYVCFLKMYVDFGKTTGTLPPSARTRSPLLAARHVV